MIDNNERKLRTGCLLLVLVGLIIFILSVIDYNKKNEDLKKNGRYTIAFTIKKHTVAKGNDYITYYFHYKDIKYIGEGDFQLNVKVPNGRYFVIFSTVNPNNNVIDFNHPVPEDIKIVPNNGWTFNDIKKITGGND